MLFYLKKKPNEYHITFRSLTNLRSWDRKRKNTRLKQDHSKLGLYLYTPSSFPYCRRLRYLITNDQKEMKMILLSLYASVS
jgi:hypothetical protein